jgi:hypothetical protein
MLTVVTFLIPIKNCISDRMGYPRNMKIKKIFTHTHSEDLTFSSFFSVKCKIYVILLFAKKFGTVSMPNTKVDRPDLVWIDQHFYVL